MKRLTSYPADSIALVLSLSVGPFVPSPAAETEKERTTQQEKGTKKGFSLRVDGLPKPIPEVMDAVKRVGDEVGKGISKVTSAGAETGNKAVTLPPLRLPESNTRASGAKDGMAQQRCQ